MTYGSLNNGSIELLGGTIGGSGSVGSVTIHGTAAADTIVINPAATAGQIEAFVNGVSQGTFTTGKVVVRAGDGNDDVQVSGSVGASAWLYGEAGNDSLHGGQGRDDLRGGAGNDSLVGGPGNDVCDGGDGLDSEAEC